MSMQAITPIILRMDSPNTLQRVYAKQNDKLSRYIVASLACGAAAWTPPEGVAGAIRFKKPDGTAGFYDTAEDGTDAIAMSGATVKMYLAEQVLTVPGEVAMEINFYTAAGAKLTSFGWTLIVKPSAVPDSAIQSTDYYNTLTAQIAKALEYKNAAAASATAAAASAEDAAATLASAVKSVNGVAPDSTGNVEIAAEYEMGTSGIWTYRKYTSGEYECWGSQTFSGTANAAWGTMFVLECEMPDYPITFAGYPVVLRDVIPNNAAGCWVAGYGAGSQTNCGTVGLVRPTSMQISAAIKIYASGRWK